jgi:hypothetical protein
LSLAGHLRGHVGAGSREELHLAGQVVDGDLVPADGVVFRLLGQGAEGEQDGSGEQSGERDGLHGSWLLEGKLSVRRV